MDKNIITPDPAQSQVLGNLVLSDAFLEELRAKSEEILNEVSEPVQTMLSRMNRFQVNAIAVRRLGFVEDVKIYVDEHPEFAPRNFDINYFNSLINQIG